MSSFIRTQRTVLQVHYKTGRCDMCRTTYSSSGSEMNVGTEGVESCLPFVYPVHPLCSINY